VACCALGLTLFAPAVGATIDGLGEMSLQELSDLQVTSVSKSAEPLRNAAASIYVITAEDIARSGATSVAEALRLAPNLQLSQYTSSNHVAGARGFAGAPNLQNFSNKLLILIDGRSVYSPLYSGVYLDAQDVLLEDVERIEVVSGPGATLWGANAMHGVINVITRPAYLTAAPLASVGVGTQERVVAARLGQRVDERLAWRAYAKVFERDATELASGAAAEDDWRKTQGGFRMDWADGADTITLQGDAYQGRVNEPGPLGPAVEGANLLGRWRRGEDGSNWQVQGYYDYTRRAQPGGRVAFSLDTFDLEAQRSHVTARHRLIWGAGLRINRFEITNEPALSFEPPGRDLTQGNLFVQDTLSLGSGHDLTVGLKAERDGYGDWHLLPDLRLSARLGDDALAWAALSRAVRSPTPFDRDVIERQGGQVILVGDADFRAEQVDTLELGLRLQPHASLSLSLALFGNRYDDLRTIEPDPLTLLPLRWDNGMRGETYGAEAWAKWQVSSWWRLSPGIRVLHKELEFSPGASGFLGLGQAGNDPRWQALLGSSMDFGAGWRLELQLRHVDELPEPRLASYRELNANLVWQATRSLDVAVTGTNLLHRAHQEYPAPSGTWIRRAALLQLRWHPSS
jgi:iron complex outermembrane receptor protein